MNRLLAGQLFWPLTERLLGRDTMRRWRELERLQRTGSEARQALQAAKLRRLLKLAAEHCPYHAERLTAAGLDVDDPALTAADLASLPAMSRDQIREHMPDLTWRGCPHGVIPCATGGSSGEPLKFFTDRARQAADWAVRWRARGWWGVRPGDVEVLLWGAPVELRRNDRLRRFRDRLLNQRMLSAFDMTDTAMAHYVELIHRVRPVCLYGYASSLALLARHAADGGQRSGGLGSPRLKAVFVTGEVLLEPDRAAIEDAFGAPAVIEYGCRDAGLLACACPAGRLHIPHENVIVELLDGRGEPVAPGEIGEVTVTPLEAFAMPLLRYQPGDLARAVPAGAGPCPCGDTSPTLLEVHGRVTDTIVCRSPDGLRWMHALALLYAIRETDGVRQYRITQPAIDLLEVELVTTAAFGPPQERTLRDQLAARMGPGTTIRLLHRRHIAPQASGKHACVVSQVAGPA